MRCAALLLLWLAAGCSSYLRETAAVRGAMARGDAAGAVSELDALAPASADRAAWLRDRGMALHASGRYLESFAVLEEAGALESQREGVSLSEEAAALAADDRARRARAFQVERGFAGLLQLLNCAALGRGEGTRVEARRLLELERTRRASPQAAWAAVSAAAWEAGGERDAARIAGEAAVALAPGLARWDWPRATPLPEGHGEVLLVIEAGVAPGLREGHGLGAGAMDVEPGTALPLARVVFPGGEVEAVRVLDVGQALREELEARRAGLWARHAAGLGVKAGIAGLVGALTHHRELGWATFQALSGAVGSDARSWRTLPAELQLVRLVMPAGVHQLGLLLGGLQDTVRVEVAPGSLGIQPAWIQAGRTGSWSRRPPAVMTSQEAVHEPVGIGERGPRAGG